MLQLEAHIIKEYRSLMEILRDEVLKISPILSLLSVIATHFQITQKVPIIWINNAQGYVSHFNDQHFMLK